MGDLEGTMRNCGCELKLDVIYQPRGRALEYGLLACNLYNGCGHGCTYCYVPGQLRKSRAEWERAEARPREDILRRLERDLEKLRDRGIADPVFLCFLTDPYHPGDTVVTREALKLIGEAGLVATVLTKGGSRAARDFDVMARYGHVLGVSVMLLHGYESRWEPGAAPSVERLETLGRAKTEGLTTWVSLEPVINDEHSLEVITTWAPAVDFFRVGKMNHDLVVESRINWKNFRDDAVRLLEERGYESVTAEEARGRRIVKRGYYLKRDLVEAAERKS